MRAGRVIEPFSLGRCVPVSGNGTKLQVHWNGTDSLAAIAGQEVRFRFVLSKTQLFAFWVSSTPSGRSKGFAAAGGPGFARGRDAD